MPQKITAIAARLLDSFIMNERKGNQVTKPPTDKSDIPPYPTCGKMYEVYL